MAALLRKYNAWLHVSLGFVLLSCIFLVRPLLVPLCRWGGYSTHFTKSKSVQTLKGLALPRACHSGEIALAGSRRLHFTLAAVPVLFAHAVVTEIKNK
jgi:hypothetical protein